MSLNHSGQQEEKDRTQNPHQKVLLLGDENLTHAKVSDVNNNVWIGTIKNAITDLLKCWVSEKLNLTPTGCIIQSGLNDTSENTVTDKIFDNLRGPLQSKKMLNVFFRVMSLEDYVA